jgi:hypothetical protein
VSTEGEDNVDVDDVVDIAVDDVVDVAVDDVVDVAVDDVVDVAVDDAVDDVDGYEDVEITGSTRVSTPVSRRGRSTSSTSTRRPRERLSTKSLLERVLNDRPERLASVDSTTEKLVLVLERMADAMEPKPKEFSGVAAVERRLAEHPEIRPRQHALLLAKLAESPMWIDILLAAKGEVLAELVQHVYG